MESMIEIEKYNTIGNKVQCNRDQYGRLNYVNVSYWMNDSAIVFNCKSICLITNIEWYNDGTIMQWYKEYLY